MTVTALVMAFQLTPPAPQSCALDTSLQACEHAGAEIEEQLRICEHRVEAYKEIIMKAHGE
jgi:hypothetical protein